MALDAKASVWKTVVLKDNKFFCQAQTWVFKILNSEYSPVCLTESVFCASARAQVWRK